MQEPGNYDITIYQGASFDRTLTWEVGTPPTKVNLTGYTGRMQIRESLAAGTAVIELTNANGRITLGGTAGTVRLDMSATDTAALNAGQYIYDLELVSSGGETTRLVEGIAIVDGEVTR